MHNLLSTKKSGVRKKGTWKFYPLLFTPIYKLSKDCNQMTNKEKSKRKGKMSFEYRKITIVYHLYPMKYTSEVTFHAMNINYQLQ